MPLQRNFSNYKWKLYIETSGASFRSCVEFAFKCHTLKCLDHPNFVCFDFVKHWYSLLWGSTNMFLVFVQWFVDLLVLFSLQVS